MLSTDLRRFPSLRLVAGTELYRIHRTTYSPWWFSSDGSSRFDLQPEPGSTPSMGTCYLAYSPVCCFVEVFRVWTLIPETELSLRRISTLALPKDAKLADCTASRSRRFGLTAEIHASVDYAMTHAWAKSFHKAGFDGIHYYLRHDPGQRCTGVALFGPAGLADYPCPPAALIGQEILRKAGARFGLRVIPEIE